MKGQPPLTLLPGEFVLGSHGQGHRILSEPGAKAVNYFDLPVEYVSRLSYEYEAAFSRAFKRVLGISLGVWRKEQKNQ